MTANTNNHITGSFYSRFIFKLLHTPRPVGMIRRMVSFLLPSQQRVFNDPSSVLAGPVNIAASADQLRIRFDTSQPEVKKNHYCKLYYAKNGDAFSEDQVICFYLRHEGPQLATLKIPDTLKGCRQVWFRLDTRGQHCAIDDFSGLHAGNDNFPMTGDEIETGPFNLDSVYLDVDIELNIPWKHSRDFKYSKLYFRKEGQSYSEDNSICFRVIDNREKQTIRIKLPSHLEKNSGIYFRVNGAPEWLGTTILHAITPLAHAEADDHLTRTADYREMKTATRRLVAQSELDEIAELPHYPESLSIELTAGCNLTCGHCSSHGNEQLHKFHNAINEFSSGDMEKLIDEVFPHLTSLTLVGRGEPTFISHTLWNQVFDGAKKYNVFVNVVSNGLLLPKRLKPEHIPWIDTLTVSIDGITPETMSANRGGVNLKEVLDAVDFYCSLRKAANLTRRPKLCLSWTLKRNNIHEYPEFIRQMVRYEPDLIYSRHLLVFHRKDSEETLLHEPELANKHLLEAYSIMEEHDIPADCPPVISSVNHRPLDNKTREAHVVETSKKAMTGAASTDADMPVPEPSQSVAAEESVTEEMPAPDPVPPVAVNIPVSSETPPPAPKARPRASARARAEANRCIYFRRSSVIMANGAVATCARPYAHELGTIGQSGTYMELWNGDDMVDCRASFGTENEWEQCTNCWYRESVYAGQRDARASGQSFDLIHEGSAFTTVSWDFRDHLDGDMVDFDPAGNRIEAENI
jgi:MoaA/NifB/PqqE/SkfB family radical SAM enzyme